MSKTIDIQVEKSKRLIEGLKAHLSDVQDKGVSTEKLESMEADLKRLAESAKIAEDLRAKLSAQVKNTNGILAECKRSYVDTKAVVRNNYPQEEWIKYGVIDKR